MKKFLILPPLILLLLSACSDWKEKQFKSCEEMASAFNGVDYNEIESEFGKPVETFEHWNEICNGNEFAYEAIWDGVGVNGKNSRIIFSAFKLSGTSSLMPMRGCSVVCD